MKNLLQNKILHYTLILAFGLLLGWWIFGSSGEELHQHSEGIDKETIWTCSMHPQIRQNEPGKCPLCGMDLIPLTSSNDAGSASPFIHTMSPQAAALANIQTSKVSYTTPEYEVYLTGKIAANEQKLASITANYSGRIERLFVDFTGQNVNKGEKMATIYSPELVTAQRELIEAAKNKQINPSLYNAVREKLRLWRITEKQIDTIESSGEVLTELDVYADISGIVITRNVSRGDYVNKGSVLFEIADLSSIWIMLDAYEQDLAWVNVGSKVNFTVASLPGKEFASTVTFVDPIINQQTRTASIRAEASNPNLQLKPEMIVQGKIITKLSSQTELNGRSLMIPKTSVLWTGIRSVVYLKVPKTDYPTFEMREVIIGPRAGDFYIVESGLTEGDEIVTNGIFAIDAAAQLSGKYSMMNRPVSKRIFVPDKFKSQLTDLTKRYFDLKNALVKSDFIATKNTGGRVSQSLQAVDMKLLDDNAHHQWMGKEDQLRKSIKAISKAKDIEEQRKHFETLSEALIESAELFGLTIDLVYVQFCPMAFDDKGAYWLSEFEEIKNPYFGDMMLTCGEVTKRISSVDSYKEKNDKPVQPTGHNH
ncbi:MAG TPA: efflux RND transporter periplasmic adaptor subunit [Ignavibacteria bacterium]|nr:efflux RND transporter periplasmic adaptor subunit [Ignavibacteria bacterium]